METQGRRPCLCPYFTPLSVSPCVSVVVRCPTPWVEPVPPEGHLPRNRPGPSEGPCLHDPLALHFTTVPAPEISVWVDLESGTTHWNLFNGLERLGINTLDSSPLLVCKKVPN